jgi:hypothetical protein
MHQKSVYPDRILGTADRTLLVVHTRASIISAQREPYTLSTFAQSESGYSDPDSVTFNESNIFVGYGNGGAPDGSGGAMSTIVEYDMTGKVVTTFTVVGQISALA